MDETPQHSPDEGAAAPAKLEYALAAGGAQRPIATFPDSGEAHIVALVLEGQGVRASVAESRAVLDFGPRPGTLLVRESDAALAIELLASTPARRRLTIPESELPPARVLKIQTCPQCGSPTIGKRSMLLRLAPAVLGLWWIPVWLNYGLAIYAALVTGWAVLVLQTPIWRCKACGYRWKDKDG